MYSVVYILTLWIEISFSKARLKYNAQNTGTHLCKRSVKINSHAED